MTTDLLADIWPEWQIVRQIGGGPFGAVYEVIRKDRQPEGRAAVKVVSIPRDAPGDAGGTDPEGALDEYVSGLRLMESLRGARNLVGVEDHRVLERTDGSGWDIYILTELLTPLDTYAGGRALSEGEAVKLGRDVCTALEMCAKSDAAHRGVRPENIFVSPSGDFKLGVFGTARQAESEEASEYIAPEIVKGAPHDAAGDLYSLGLVLYRLMNRNRPPFLNAEGRRPESGEYTAALRRRLNGEPLPAPCDASPAMRSLILSACSPNLNRRFASAAAMRNALTGVPPARRTSDGAAQAASARRAPQAGQTPAGKTAVPSGAKQKKSNKAPVIIAVVLVIAVLTAAGVFLIPRLLDRADKGPSGGGDEIDSIISEAEKLAYRNDFSAALEKVREGLESYPDSEELMDKAEEYAEAIEEEIDAIISKAERSAAKDDFERALGTVREGLETYPGSEELLAKEEEYTAAIGEQKRGKTVTMERIWDSGNEYAVFTGLNAQGEAVWTYETRTYPQMQLDTISEIGVYEENYYMEENGSIYALKIADGSVRWVNDDFAGSVSCGVFDDDGTLYLCGHLGPDLFVVGADGKTIHRSGSFDSEYLWPYDIAYQGTQVAITFDQAPEGADHVVYVDLRDYATSIPERSEILPVSMADILTVTASSYLEEAQYGYIHGPSNVIDGDLSTAWVEGADGQGEGESITIRLGGICTVSGFTINAGYQKSGDAYSNNSRPAVLRVTFSDGNSAEAYLDDVNAQQMMTLNTPVDTSSVTFTIVSVYPGSTYQDTAITEISLF